MRSPFDKCFAKPADLTDSDYRKCRVRVRGRTPESALVGLRRIAVLWKGLVRVHKGGGHVLPAAA